MADTFLGADVGDELPFEITVASSTTSKAVELRVLVGTAQSRVATISAVLAILARLEESRIWPPATFP